MQRLSLVDCFTEIVDPRIERTKQHLLTDILSLSVLAVIAGAEGWEDIEDFGQQKQVWLPQFLRLPNGIPSHDTISRVFRRLKPGAFDGGATRVDGIAPRVAGLNADRHRGQNGASFA